tara:strand:+ start:202 stop:1026 length:825 start_codon:yes stop_codon:yes gene_type:complete
MIVECFIIFYNHEKFIKDRLLNVFNIFDPKYVTLIDDFSTDNTRNEIENFLSKNKTTCNFLKNPSNFGILKNWFLCTVYCQSKYIWILEGDDLTDDNFLKIFKKTNESIKDLDLFSGVTHAIDSKNRITGKQSDNIFRKLNIDFLLKKKVVKFSQLNFFLSIFNIFPNIGSFIFKNQVLNETLFKLTSYKLNIRYSYDWLLYYKLSQNKNLNFHFNKNAINYFRIHEDNFSEQNNRDIKMQEIKSFYKTIDEYFKISKNSNLKTNRANYLKSLK